MFVLFRAVVYATLFIGVVLVYLPGRFLVWSGIVRPTTIGAAQLAGMLFGSIGAAIALWCVLTFAFVGKGTPAPFDPPRKLVVRGPYHFVRNPMYIGAGLALAGAALFYRSWALLLYTGVFFVITHLFVLLYEEPILRRTFASEYEEYCKRVHRWRPNETALAAFGRAVPSLIHYLYLARVPLLGWTMLIGLPLLAWSVGRPFVLGAYDLFPAYEGFFVGIAYGLAGGSIYFTAHIITNLCSKRFRLNIDPDFQPRIDLAWAIAIGIALVVNLVTAAAASKPDVYYSTKLLVGLVVGILIACAGAYIAGEISRRMPNDPVYRSVVRIGLLIGLRNQKGYMRAVSDDIDTNDPTKWEYEDGQIRAVSYTFIVFVTYCIIIINDIAPLVALMLLLTLAVLILAGITFFWDRYRLPLLLILIAYFWLIGFSWRADHYYRVWTRPPVDPELTPSQVVGRAAQQPLPVVIVSAAGGGIQSAAWTTSVLKQLGERLAHDSGGAYDLPRSIRLISGVSGGSVGAMFYAQGFSETPLDFRHSFQAARSSCLAPTVRGLLRQDLWRALAPFLVTDIFDDRGRVLERQWCRNFDDRFRSNPTLADATLSSWGADALSLKRPALIFNSTIVETGQRLAISTVPMKGTLIGETEFSQRYCAEIAISTAARLSATFPFITPTGRPTMQNPNAKGPIGSARPVAVFPPCGGGDQHVVDGGYYENSGLVGAIEWIDDALTDLTKPERNPKGYPLPRDILLLSIDAFEKPTDPEDPCPEQAAEVPASTAVSPEPAHGVLYNFASPLRAVMNVRGSGQKSFARRLLRMCQRRWALEGVNIRDVKIFFEVQDPKNREKSVDITQRAQIRPTEEKAGPFYIGVDPGNEPLSWHLRSGEIEELRKQWKGFNNPASPENCKDNYTAILDFFKSQSAKTVTTDHGTTNH